MNKITEIRKLLKKLSLDGYLIPKNDEFFNEYIKTDKDNLKFISDFSGSFGFALILMKKNYLFVDGRYTLQAQKQSGKYYQIITMPKKLPLHIFKKKKLHIGIDPRLHTQLMINNFFKSTKCSIVSLKENLIDKIWKNKNKLSLAKKFYFLKENIVGQSLQKKIHLLNKIIIKKKIDYLFVTSSENIAWLLNIRGSDSDYSPLPNGFLIIDKFKKGIFFCDLKKIDKRFEYYLNEIKIIDINKINSFLNKIKNKKIQIDSKTCSIFFKYLLKEDNKIIEEEDPIYFLKSIKNKTEINNTIKSHIYDGVALTKFLIWLDKNYKDKKITEIDAQNKLLYFRKKNKKFISSSFPTISGSGPNGAVIHYRANKRSNRLLKKGDIYLVDSGGQYKFGTTDVTRTISLDSEDVEIKNNFTRVLKGHIAVASFIIKSQTTGADIDFAARKPLKDFKLDYAHGTGHGVGYFLNVHEGPQAISSRNKITFKEGVIISNEPGYYKNGKYGIRIENLITVKKDKKFLKFVNLTLAPIDKSLINKKFLNKEETLWLNTYHLEVFDKLKKFMNKNEVKNLTKMCSNI